MKRVALLHKALYKLKILDIPMIKYYGLYTLYTYIGDSGLAWISSKFASILTEQVKYISTLHFPNMHAFLKNGKQP